MVASKLVRRLAPIAALGLATACGFLGAPDPPSLIPDGLGPFARPVPLEICDGASRWVGTTTASAMDPAGFCVPPSALPTPCASRHDCRAREQCICGRCTVPVCASDSECDPGETCQSGTSRCGVPCSAAVPCPGGAHCDAGLCVVACGASTDCAKGEHCDAAGRCVALPCNSDAACGGDRCDTQRSAMDLREPAIVSTGEPFPLVLYLEVGRQAVWRAVSLDGVRFTVTPRHPVLAVPGERVGAPSVTRLPDGSWVMAAARGEDQSVILATSPDGVTFDPPVTALRPVEDWEGSQVGSPGIAWFAHELVLSYTARDGIGLALVNMLHSGAPVVTRVRDPVSGTARVLSPGTVTDPLFWRLVDTVGAPDLVPVRVGNDRAVLRMYFAARGAEASANITDGTLRDPPIHWSVGVAAAVEGSWSFTPSPFDPVLTRIEGLGDTRDAREPAALDMAGPWILLVRGETLQGTDEGLFRSPP